MGFRKFRERSGFRLPLIQRGHAEIKRNWGKNEK